MTLSPDGKHAYITATIDDAVSWYERNASTGALTYGGVLKDGVNGVDGLNGALGVILSSDGKHAYVTGDDDNKVSWYERNASTGALIYGGKLKDGLNGVDGLKGPKSVILSSDGNHAYVTGEDDNAVSWYERNASTGALIYGGKLKDGLSGVDGLIGAWGLSLSSDGKHAYVTGYNDDAVSWYERNVSTGALSYGGMLKDDVDGVDGLKGALSVTLSPDGNHAYVTAISEGVSWYERNASTGALTYGGILKDGVNGVDGLLAPISVILSSNGKHAYVTGRSDDAVSWFTRDPLTGALSYGSASDANYTLTAADAGSVITVVASFTDGGGSFEQVSSLGTIPLETQSIAWNQAFSSLEYGAADIALSASASSGLSVNYESSDTSVLSIVNGTVLRIHSAGQATISAKQAGDANYAPATDESKLITVSPRALTASASAADKVYDGTTIASTTLYLSGLVGSETLNSTVGSNFDTKDVGTGKTVTVNSITLSDGTNGGLAANYSLGVGQTTTADITAKPITVTGITASNKVYDGQTVATIDVSGINETGIGLLAGDTSTVTISATGVFSDKNVGTGKMVTLTGSVSGADAANYSFTHQANTTADITTKALTATASAANKVYDGNNTALTTLSLSGLVGSETLNSTVWSTFDTKDVGIGKTVTVNSITLSDGTNGGLAANYSLGVGQTTAADILASNSPPTDLNSTALLTVAEDQPVGSIVGEFNANDPDSNATLSYHLISGVGDTDNFLFTIDTNGTIRTAVIFDYETNASGYSIRVQVRDDQNATAEGNFSVIVTDIYEASTGQLANENNQTELNQPNFENNETKGGDNAVLAGNSTIDHNTSLPYIPEVEFFRPFVKTGQSEGVLQTSATLTAAIPDNGGSVISKRGFLISVSPNPKFNGHGVIDLMVELNASTFATTVEGLDKGKKYYYKAYASNAEGTGFGLEETFVTASNPSILGWAGAQPANEQGWWTSPWFGEYYKAGESGWLLHTELGWLYGLTQGDDTAGVWLWQERLSWVWTGKDLFPFIYLNDSGSWMFLYGRGTGDKLLLYDYGELRWLTLDNP